MSLITATADFFQKNGKNYASFFLINGAENLKGWQVVPASIPKFIQTFKGMPFISEPQLGHFGADDMKINDVVTEQEKYRVGNIKEVKFDQRTMTAEAIVEFADNPQAEKVWNDIQKGEAIYVSPAVAGIAVNGPRGPIFHEWYGLHLARVKNPAYGVHHASIKRTCSGPEQECVRQLVASASKNTGTSFICPFTNSNKMDSTSQEISTADYEKIVAENASLKSEIAKLQTAQTELKTLSSEFANVQKALAEKEDEEKEKLAKEVASLKQALAVLPEDDKEVEKEVASLKKLSVAELKRTHATLTASVDNVKKFISENASKSGTRIVKPVSVASADAGSKTEIKDVRATLQEMF